MKIQEITAYLEGVAPLSYQEEYDNCGLLVGDENSIVKGVLVTLDCTEAIIREAVETGCNLIIAHHPIIFKGLRKLNGRNYIERAVIKAIRNDIAIYAIHTNLDNVHNGVNAKIANKLCLKKCKILAPKNEKHNPNVGAGIIGELAQEIESKVFLKNLKTILKTDCVRYTSLVKTHVKKVAVCGGSGSSFLHKAKALNADIYISADFKYHEFFDAEENIIIADVGHYESEQFTKDLIYDFLTKNFTKFAVRLSKINTNPIKYI